MKGYKITGGKRQLERLRYRREDNIKMNLEVIDCEDVG
jgi:hypothetical protein